jgi:hypothetical protein
MSSPLLQPNDTSIAEARSLFKDADSVELKITVADGDRHSAITALGLDVLDAELRQVVFFDTPDLTLDHAGIIVRARRARKGGDSVIKLRQRDQEGAGGQETDPQAVLSTATGAVREAGA